MGDSESLKSVSRPVITPPRMYALLINEFAKLRPSECTRCRASLPYCGSAPGNQLYWFMQAPPACPHGCHQVLAELWARLTTEYKIAPPEKERWFAKSPGQRVVSQK